MRHPNIQLSARRKKKKSTIEPGPCMKGFIRALKEYTRKKENREQQLKYLLNVLHYWTTPALKRTELTHQTPFSLFSVNTAFHTPVGLASGHPASHDCGLRLLVPC